MNRSLGIFVLLIGVALNCAGQENVVSGNQSYRLSDEEALILAEQANAGSPTAAMKLSDRYFYRYSVGRKKREESAKALTWALIGAENGSAEAQFRVYQLLSISDKRPAKMRALFWLKQSAKNGNVYAQAAQKLCPEIDAKRPNGIACFGKGSDGNE